MLSWRSCCRPFPTSKRQSGLSGEPSSKAAAG
jgi:hypothetical protein